MSLTKPLFVGYRLDLLLPFGSNMIREGAELAEELPVALEEDEKAALELETDPMLLAVPIG